LAVVRVALVAFVLAWPFGPYPLRSAVPIWLVFALALGLELHFSVDALRAHAAPARDRGPQAVDRERYGSRTRRPTCCSSARETPNSGSPTRASKTPTSKR
jgi:hypothetical protein